MASPPTLRPLIASSGHICLWQGASLWAGRGAGRTQRHSHHAHQVAVSLEGVCRFRSGRDAEWASFAGAFVPSHCEHEFEFDGRIAHLFVEPETPEGRALSLHFPGQAVSALPPDSCRQLATMLGAAEAAGARGDGLVTAGKSALALLAGSLPAGAPVDLRVTDAIAHVTSRIREPVSLADAASAVFLSPGRFRHLFVSETGTPFRAYLLWMRLQVALSCAMGGGSWTTAAHEAGFADAAHLTRTFRRMFGINPSDLANLPRQV